MNIKYYNLLIFSIIYFIIAMLYVHVDDNSTCSIDCISLIYFIIISLNSITYSIIIFRNIQNFKIIELLKNYFLLLFVSNFTNICLIIVYDFPDWGVDYEGLAVGFIYFIISIIITFIFYITGIFLVKIKMYISRKKNSYSFNGK